jgi:hypothetical protein
MRFLRAEVVAFNSWAESLMSSLGLYVAAWARLVSARAPSSVVLMVYAGSEWGWRVN